MFVQYDNLCEDHPISITIFNGGENEVRKKIEKYLCRLPCHCTVQGLPSGLLIKMKLKYKTENHSNQGRKHHICMNIVVISILPRHNCGDQLFINLYRVGRVTHPYCPQSGSCTIQELAFYILALA